jgi:hypothetical protein
LKIIWRACSATYSACTATSEGARYFRTCFSAASRSGDGDEAVLEHAIDDVALAPRGTLRVDDRVVRRRRLGQAGEHRRLGDGDVLERLAEIDFAGRGESVGALPERDMVHVDLENLVLAEQAFDLQRKQHLVDLASKCFLGREIEIARDLHRDRRCTLCGVTFAEVGEAGAKRADIVDTLVLVEARVLDREDGVLHDLRDLRDRHEAAPLFAEFTEENAVRREDAHRQLRPVVGEAVDLGQVGVGHRQRDRRDHHHGEGR